MVFQCRKGPKSQYYLEYLKCLIKRPFFEIGVLVDSEMTDRHLKSSRYISEIKGSRIHIYG